MLSRCLQSLLDRPPGSGYEAFGELLLPQVGYDRLTLCAAEPEGAGLRVLHSLAGDHGSSEVVGRLLPLANSLAGTVLRDQRRLLIRDLAAYAAGQDAVPVDVRRALAVGMRSVLMLPLGTERAPGDHRGAARAAIGVCKLWSRTAGHFTPAHEALLEDLRPGLSAALRNDLLYLEAERRSLELGALERLSRATRASLDLKSVIPVCLDTALGLLGLATGGLLLLRGDRLELVLERNLPQALEPLPLHVPLHALRSPLVRALRERRSVLCEDLQADPQLAELIPAGGRRVWLLAIPLLALRPKGVVFASGFDSFPQQRSELERLATIGHWIGSAIDDAEHHEEQRKRQQLESLGGLAGGLAHDFNNTLGAVLLTALLLREAAVSGDRARLTPEGLVPELDTVIAAARRGASLAGQLLAFSKGAPLHLLPLDMNDVVTEALRPLRSESGLVLETALGRGLQQTRGDREQLVRAVSNLLHNAVEAMPGGGRLYIETRLIERAAEPDQAQDWEQGLAMPAGRYVRLLLRDEGPGIDPAVRARLFEPFVTTKKSAPGLGLAVVFGVVKAHNGCVLVDSAPGRGTTFVIDLPVVLEAALAAQPERRAVPAPACPAAAASKEAVPAARVLVVDDEPVLTRIAARILRGAGYAVDVASSGVDALSRYTGPGAYDVVVLDSTMPGMSGREVLDQLLLRDPAARVLVMSGYSMDGGPADLLARGARGFLPKPFTPQDLLAATRAAQGDPALS